MSEAPNQSDLANPRFPKLEVALPAWVESFLPPVDHLYRSDEERMELAINLARKNIEQGTGGPFGAAVFDLDSQTLLAPGVNVVVSTRWSGGHAEMVAFAMAQQLVGSHDLGSEQHRRYEIVTSCEPCSMCFGATPWSGVKRLVCGATEADARAIGFDEGPKPENWIEALHSRGIEVIEGICRAEAAQVLRDYATTGGHIYNGRGG